MAAMRGYRIVYWLLQNPVWGRNSGSVYVRKTSLDSGSSPE